MDVFEVIGAGAGTTRILDFFLAGCDLRDGAWQFAPRIPEIELECQSFEILIALKGLFQRGVRDRSAIPIMLAFDLNCREPGWQCSARHDVFRTDRVRRGVEIDEITAPHIDRADAKSHLLGVNAVEIDQVLERLPEAAGIVKARSRYSAGRMQPRSWKSCREESACATGQSGIGAHLVQPLAHSIALHQKQPLTPITIWLRDTLPKRSQLSDACFRGVAGNQRPIDGADRDARDPIGMNICCVQCLIDSGLIGAERTAPLEDECDVLERWTRPRF